MSVSGRQAFSRRTLHGRQRGRGNDARIKMGIIMKNAVSAQRTRRMAVERAMPATEEQRYHQRGNGDVPMYSPTKNSRFHTGIFDVVTVRQFLLGFRLVKRVTVTDAATARDGESNKPKNCGIVPECARLLTISVASK